MNTIRVTDYSFSVGEDVNEDKKCIIYLIEDKKLAGKISHKVVDHDIIVFSEEVTHILENVEESILLSLKNNASFMVFNVDTEQLYETN